ncbi:DUF3304 domain-containing protein [Pseudoduganella flava]|nr:DUF3304 domain-containing protein [Pseudoduganella flava]
MNVQRRRHQRLPTDGQSRLAAVIVALGLAFPALVGCTPQQHHTQAREARRKPVMLAISGYNYTNRHIGSFSVNGQGGGNIFVSTPTSGGGGSTCCVSYVPGKQVRKVTVRWEADACYYHVKSTMSNEVYDDLHPIFKEREVVIDEDIPQEPQNFEVHFYPDGSIRAAITSEIALPRLQLPAEREDKSRYPRCPNDRKPDA